MDNYFAYYGLPERYEIDLAALRTQYLERARAEHPDYHRQADDLAQRLDATARNNDAYRTLADPRLRLLHLLALAGLLTPTGENLTDRRPEPAFLMEIMELNEEAESTPPDRLASLAERIATELVALEAQIRSVMLRHDAAPDAASRQAHLEQALDFFLKQQYWQRLKNLVDSRMLL